MSPVLREEASRLDDRRLSVYEDWFEAELLLGNHAEVLDEIEAVVRGHPLRERLRSHQLTALYRGGRQAEALAEYDNLRQLLTAELGLDPSPALQQLYRSILVGDPVLGTQAPARLGRSTRQNPPRPSSSRRGSRSPPRSSPTSPACRSPRTGPATGERASDRPPASRLSGLPRAADDFTGRREVLGDLLALFGDAAQAGSHLRRVAAIVGPPGAGTSTLALQAAHALAPRFRDGPVLLSLHDEKGAPRPPAELIEELLTLLESFPGSPPAASPDRSALLRRQLAGLPAAADHGRRHPRRPRSGRCFPARGIAR